MALRWNADELEEKDSVGVTDDSRGDFSGGLRQGYELGSLTDGLVAYFPFDGGVEDKALSNNVTDNTSADFVSGRIGQAKDFDGNDDYIQINDTLNYEMKTLAVWLKPPREYTGDDTRAFVSSDPDIAFGSYTADFSGETLTIGESGTTSITNTISQEWHHFVFRWNESASKYDIYMDGVKRSTGSGNNPDADLITNFSPEFGARTSTSEFSSVKIDDVHIYERSLSQPEIKALYQRTQTQQITDKDRLTSGLVGHWPLNEDEAGKAYDLSGNNFDSTSVTGTTTAVGLGGAKARRFGGENNELVHPKPIQISGTNDHYTVSFWVRTSQSSDEHFYSDFNGSNYSFDFRISNGIINFQKYDGDTLPQTTSTLSYNDGKWHHIVGVRDSNELKLFIDGSIIDSVEDTTTEFSNSNDALLGRDNIDGAGGYFEGDITDTRWYNRSLTESEIETLAMNGGLDV